MVRRVKQTVYGIFYLAVLGGIIAGIYFLFLRPAPSCFDGIQNEGEQGVDCGGPCAKAGLPSGTQPITATGPIFIFSPIAGHASVLVQVENANAGLAASSFDYAITLYGADGSTTVASFAGNSFAYADETKYLILPNEPVSASTSRADFAVSNVQWISASLMGQPPQFAFTNVTDAVDANGYVDVSGNITDRDVASFNDILIAAVFKTAAGTPIGASQTQINSLTPGATQNFSISYPMIPNEDIAATELEAYAGRN